MRLEATGLSKSFAGVRALAGASLDVVSGEIHALVGENGAGKSTLVGVLTGAVQPDAGRVTIDGHPVELASPADARRLGLVAIHQHPALFPDLTVAENLALGRESIRPWHRVDWAARRTRAAELLARVGARIDVDREAGSLRLPEQQLVEIARALGAEARLLILDEPTASLTPREVDRLFELLDALRRAGTALVYITHRLEELPRIADRVTVLRDGRTVGTDAMSDVDGPMLIRRMVGRDLASVFPKPRVPIGEPVLEVTGLTSQAAGIRDVTLSVRRGEIVGLAGLVGAGRTELARVLFGLVPADDGTIRLNGRILHLRSPRDAIAAGIAYLPEDRRQHGVVLNLPVASNLTLARLADISRHGLLDRGAEQAIAARLVRELDVRPPAPDMLVGELSGGNQQKVAIGRWLVAPPALLVLDEPTQGVDVGAKAEIHRVIGNLAARGLGVLMISSELPEVLGMCDRIAVMRDGTVVATFDRDAATAEAVMGAAFGTVTA
ncbi:MAG TPA: sugar ABC transporter ATP-binding protein [Methylomirabilota bacterium]